MRELLGHGWRLLPISWRQALKHRLFSVRDMSTRLQNLRRAGFVCTGAIDGGAFRGEWAREFWSAFPSVPVLMVEPQHIPLLFLRELARSVPGSEVLAVALSDQPGSASFALQESNSGIREGASPDEESIDVPCMTLVEILAARTGFRPNLLKLNLQGHELQAMKGARERLKGFEVIICELSIIPIGGVPAFAEVNGFLEQQGYRLYDVLPMWHRPLDGALWQVDAFYVRSNSILVASTQWR